MVAIVRFDDETQGCTRKPEAAQCRKGGAAEGWRRGVGVLRRHLQIEGVASSAEGVASEAVARQTALLLCYFATLLLCCDACRVSELVWYVVLWRTRLGGRRC